MALKVVSGALMVLLMVASVAAQATIAPADVAQQAAISAQNSAIAAGQTPTQVQAAGQAAQVRLLWSDATATVRASDLRTPALGAIILVKPERS